MPLNSGKYGILENIFLRKIVTRISLPFQFKYTQLEIQFNKLQAAQNNNRGGSEAGVGPNVFSAPSSTTESSHRSTKGVQVLQRSFDEQVLVADNTYQIPIHIHSSGGAAAPSNTNKSLQTSLINNRSMDLNRPPASSVVQRPLGNGIINSVENFQMLPKPLAPDERPLVNDNENVLKGPPEEKDQKLKSSTATLDKAELADKSLGLAKPIAMAQQQSLDAPPEQVVTSTSTKSRKVPKGVVPIPKTMGEFLNNDAPKRPVNKDASTEDTLNNRYENAMHAAENSHNNDEISKDQVNFLQNGNEIENLAHEVNDFNIVEDRNHHDHLQGGLDDNAAEVDANHEGKDKGGEIDLTIINRELQLGVDKEKGNEVKRVEKVNEDFVGDQGFDDHMEEHVEEEDGEKFRIKLEGILN